MFCPHCRMRHAGKATPPRSALSFLLSPDAACVGCGAGAGCLIPCLVSSVAGLIQAASLTGMVCSRTTMRRRRGRCRQRSHGPDRRIHASARHDDRPESARREARRAMFNILVCTPGARSRGHKGLQDGKSCSGARAGCRSAAGRADRARLQDRRPADFADQLSCVSIYSLTRRMRGRWSVPAVPSPRPCWPWRHDDRGPAGRCWRLLQVSESSVGCPRP
jgi:hypothetical protein